MQANVDAFFDIFFILLIIVWGLTFVQSHRMFYRFRKKYSEIAEKEIPNAFSSRSHPEKIIFFFREKNRQLLQADHEVWRLREQTKILIIFSLCFPFLFIVIFFLLALLGVN